VDADWRDLEAIKRLKHKYMRCLDRKLWDELRDLFVPDATAAYSSGKYAFTGRDAILEFLTRSMGSPRFLSSHCVHQPEIELTSPTTAKAHWALEDTVHILDAGLTIRGAALYEDSYVKGADGQWRIQHTGYSRTWEEMFPRASIAGLKLTASLWETGGKSKLDV
jgi:hypothetical protein